MLAAGRLLICQAHCVPVHRLQCPGDIMFIKQLSSAIVPRLQRSKSGCYIGLKVPSVCLASHTDTNMAGLYHGQSSGAGKSSRLPSYNVDCSKCEANVENSCANGEPNQTVEDFKLTFGACDSFRNGSDNHIHFKRNEDASEKSIVQSFNWPIKTGIQTKSENSILLSNKTSFLRIVNRNGTVNADTRRRSFHNSSRLIPNKYNRLFGNLSKINCDKYIHSTTNYMDLYRSSNSVIRKKPPWRILFFGTDDIALDTLKALHKNMNTSSPTVESLEVVTISHQRTVRPVRRYAESEHLVIHDWPIRPSPDKYDVGVLVSFGHLIPDSIIHMFPYGILNMHPSLLPRWRGASPIIHTILNDDKETGISVMEIRPKHFDIGPLLLQRRIPVPHRLTSFQLADKLGKIGACMVLECLEDLPTLERQEHEQDEKGISYAHKISSVNANVDWENQTAWDVDCHHRAVHELIPLRSELKGQKVKLLDIVDLQELADADLSDARGYKGDITLADPGTVTFHKNLECLIIKCKDGIVGFKKIVIRKTLSAQAFYNGYLASANQSVQFTSLDNDLNKYMKHKMMPLKKVVKL